MGGVLGLDYPAVEVLIRAAGEPLRLIHDIQMIERGAVDRLRELADERKEKRGAKLPN